MTKQALKRTVEFIRQHACEGVKVAEVVRHLRIARRTLDQHFADQLGHSPAEEIRRVRLISAFICVHLRFYFPL